jgi:CheY-like chemotaxis protein
MLLACADRPESTERCQELGVAAQLIKPIKQSHLLEAIQEAMGRVALDITPVKRKAAQAAPAKVSRTLRILLAEDNAFNQRVSVLTLQGQGHTVRVAATGHEVLTALEQESFDVVLMDVQMPEMDGLEATLAIRRREQETGRRIPIIALTAHAMKGDRERCLEAGMDGYVSKPIQAKELYLALENCVVGAAPAPAAVQPLEPVRPSSAVGPVFDLDATLARVEGDRDLLLELIEVFRADYPQRLAEIRTALDQADAQMLHRSAHSLKGALGFFAAPAALEAARRLEAMGRAGDLASGADEFARLEEASNRLESALTAVIAEPLSTGPSERGV